MFGLLNFFRRDGKLFYAVAVLVGTMVGVGVFGLPFAFSKSGFWIGFSFLLGTTLLILLVDLMYGEVVLRTQEKHQIVGYARLYLGKFSQRLLFFTSAFTGYAALLAYIIISGDFLNNIFSPVFLLQTSTYSILFFIVMAALVFKGIKTVSKIELFLTFLFVLVIMMIFISGLGKIKLPNYNYFIPEFWFLPYGVLLFALSGLLAIPIQRQILINKENLLKKAIFVAVLLSAGLYFLFTFTVVGVSGELTSPDAISGLFEFLGPKITFLGSFFGIVAVSTSFLMLASGMMEIFNFDFKIGRRKAWALTTFPPLLLFMGGIRTFVDVISLAGAVALGLEGTILVILFARAKHLGNRVPEYSLNIPKWVLYLIILVFLAGVFYGLFIN